MIRILCLDQSSHTGWCHGVPGETPIYGTQRLPSSLKGAARAEALYRFVKEIVEANGVGKIYFEKPIMPKVTSFDAVYGLMGLATAIGFAAVHCGITCYAIDMQTWRSEFGAPTQAPKKIKGTTERRVWLKQQTIARCNAIGLSPSDDNAGDAIGLWWAMAERVIAKDRQPTFSFDDAPIAI